MPTLEKRKYTFNELEQKYREFRGPATRVVVDGKDIKLSHGIEVSNLTLETTSTQEADVLRFSIPGAYDQTAREFRWLNNLMELGKTVKAHLGYGDQLHEVFYGYITSVGVSYSNNGSAELQVTAMDPSFLLMRGRKFRSFLNKKVSDFVKEIADSYALKAEINDTNTAIPVFLRKPQSDFQFLHELALSVNYEFFIVGDKLYFRKKGSEQTPFATLQLGVHLMSVSVEQNLSEQVAKVRVRSWDEKEQRMIDAHTSQVNRIGENTKTGPDLISALSGELEEVLYVNALDKTSARNLASAILNERALRLVSGEAECIGIPEIRSGRYVKLEGLGKRLNQIYYINRATHIFDDNGYVTNFTFQGNAV
jgi:hypothetical protein